MELVAHFVYRYYVSFFFEPTVFYSTDLIQLMKSYDTASYSSLVHALASSFTPDFTV